AQKQPPSLFNHVQRAGIGPAYAIHPVPALAVQLQHVPRWKLATIAVLPLPGPGHGRLATASDTRLVKVMRATLLDLLCQASRASQIVVALITRKHGRCVAGIEVAFLDWRG